MVQWIEVKVRYEKLTEKGVTIKVTEPFLVDALSCTEAEARIVEEVSPYVSGELNVLSVNKTKISDVFWNVEAERFYKVKVNYITIDEKTGAEKRSGTYILVQASNFSEAFSNFNKGMQGSDGTEIVPETVIVDKSKPRSDDD